MYCTVESCPNKRDARGLCKAHWKRWRKTGLVPTTPVRHKAPDGTGRANKYGYMRTDVAGRQRYLHRIVMEDMIMRPLCPGETVHHKNGDRSDNRPENLELWSTRQPVGQRVSDKVAWAKELLAQYEPAVLAQTDMPFWAMSP